MRVAVTGATGTIGAALVAALTGRGDSVVVLSRNPDRARSSLAGVEAVAWPDPAAAPPPADALSGCDGVVNLAGEQVAQRWSDDVKRRIRDSRVIGTRNLIGALGAADPRPAVLVSGSASGWYGARGDEPVDESEPPATDFLAGVAADWEREAERAEDLGMRVVRSRTGVVLSESGGALEKMLPPFKLGVGGPVAGGRQYVPWIHLDDVAGALLACLDDDRARGPVNLAAPAAATNRELSRTLGRVLGRPALLPVPGLALKALYGEMASIITTGARVVPRRLEELGYDFRQPALEPALRAATGR